MKKVFLVIAIAFGSGCSAVNTADEYGASTADVIFACGGETWKSKELSNNFCLMTSVKDPHAFVIAEDTAETYGAAVLAGATFGISLLFDKDIQEEWLRASKEFAREKYGEGARVINFRRHEQTYKGYAFEVIPPYPQPVRAAVTAKPEPAVFESSSVVDVVAQKPALVSENLPSEILDFQANQQCIGPTREVQGASNSRGVFYSIDCGDGETIRAQCLGGVCYKR